jgi:hypothetical protein
VNAVHTWPMDAEMSSVGSHSCLSISIRLTCAPMACCLHTR